MALPVGEKRINPDITKAYYRAKGLRDEFEENDFIRLFNKFINWINRMIYGKPDFFTKKEEELIDIVLDVVDDVYKADYTKFIRDYWLEGDKIVNKDGVEYEQKDRTN